MLPALAGKAEQICMCWRRLSLRAIISYPHKYITFAFTVWVMVISDHASHNALRPDGFPKKLHEEDFYFIYLFIPYLTMLPIVKLYSVRIIDW
jgi:hypothetical protein